MNQVNSKNFDVIIAGAGPAGATAAMQLGNSKLKVAVIEKEVFPRDKICGDALSADVLNQLKLIGGGILNEFKNFEHKQKIKNLSLIGSKENELKIELLDPEIEGATAKRIDFDTFLFNQLKKYSNIEVFENHKIIEVTTHENYIEITTSQNRFKGAFVLAADGANSVVKSKLVGKNFNPNNFSAGLRQYFENVEFPTTKETIELHFLKGTLPGYLWVFPLPNNQANVGIGMLSAQVRRKKINLKNHFSRLIKEHPQLKNRFKNAKPLESVKGFNLPLGNKKVKCSGNRFLLLGDAAHLIDPFSGEGIANAIRSGRVAADHVLQAFYKNRFDTDFNKAYDKEIYRRMWSELRVNSFLLRLMNYPRVFNFLLKKASNNDSIRMVLISSLQNVNMDKQLRKPSFYWKLLFG